MVMHLRIQALVTVLCGYKNLVLRQTLTLMCSWIRYGRENGGCKG
jgi:hypothetical protein